MILGTLSKRRGKKSTTVQSPWSILAATLGASNPQIVNHWYRKSITILHLWPSHPLFSLLYGSGTVCKSRNPSSWPHFPCGWHDFLPLHCVFLYGRILPDRITLTPMPGKWHLVWLSSKLYKWVLHRCSSVEMYGHLDFSWWSEMQS